MVNYCLFLLNMSYLDFLSFFYNGKKFEISRPIPFPPGHTHQPVNVVKFIPPVSCVIPVHFPIFFSLMILFSFGGSLLCAEFAILMSSTPVPSHSRILSLFGLQSGNSFQIYLNTVSSLFSTVWTSSLTGHWSQ